MLSSHITEELYNENMSNDSARIIRQRLVEENL